MTINTNRLSMGAQMQEEERPSASPKSWEITDLQQSFNKLKFEALSNDGHAHIQVEVNNVSLNAQNNIGVNVILEEGGAEKDKSVKDDDAVEKVDQFLRDALQNPRDRLTILRMELDVQKFMQNTRQQQLDFPHLPTSYLRLAAHRVAQHYGLQSMVVDWKSVDGFGSRIIARKTPESRYPAVQLADIPVNLPQEKINDVKFAIKPRPQTGLHGIGHNNGHNLSPPKSVEERKEEYNRARDRIFNRSSSCDLEAIAVEAAVDMVHCSSNGTMRTEEDKSNKDDFQIGYARDPPDFSSDTDIHKPKTERRPVHGVKTSNSRIAIFRDHEKDRNDPDYNRSYGRLSRNTQNFDPAFGLNLGPFGMQNSFAPAMQYNPEIPHLSPLHMMNAYMDATAAPGQQHACGPWVLPPCTLGYGPLNAIMGSYNPCALSAPAMCSSSQQFVCPSPTITYAHHEHFQQTLAHPQLRLQHDINFSKGRYC